MIWPREPLAYLLVITIFISTYVGSTVLLFSERYVLGGVVGMIGWIFLHVAISLLPDWVEGGNEEND